MCLILCGYRISPGIDLLLASNRDERYERPADYAHFWKPDGQILAGRDVEAGGTWLGVSRSGCLAAVTNVREPVTRHSAPSRGELPLRFLKKPQSVEDFVGKDHDLAGFNGFNLLLWDGRELAVVSNRTSEVTTFGPGVVGLSNGHPTANWPKVEVGKQRLETELLSGRWSSQSVLDIMRDTAVADDDQLPDTGIGIVHERLLSSAFIQSLDYGTRCTTVVTFWRNGLIDFQEYTYDGTPDVVHHEQFRFQRREPQTEQPSI